MINRLQNVVITLDKVKMVLQAPNQASVFSSCCIFTQVPSASQPGTPTCLARRHAAASGTLPEDAVRCRGRRSPLVRSAVTSAAAARVLICNEVCPTCAVIRAGPRAVARRVLSGCIQMLAPAVAGRAFASLQTDEELQAAGEIAHVSGGWDGVGGRVSSGWCLPTRAVHNFADHNSTRVC